MEIYLSSKRQEKITLKEYPFMENFVIKFTSFLFLWQKEPMLGGLFGK
jgi:hypothetical protein